MNFKFVICDYRHPSLMFCLSPSFSGKSNKAMWILVKSDILGIPDAIMKSDTRTINHLFCFLFFIKASKSYQWTARDLGTPRRDASVVAWPVVNNNWEAGF